MRRRTFVSAVPVIALMAACDGELEPPPTPSRPIVETLYVPRPRGAPGGLVVAQGTDGVFHAPISRVFQLRLRADWPAKLLVGLDGQALMPFDDKLQHPEFDEKGYFNRHVEPLPGPSGGPLAFFWRVTVSLPIDQQPLAGSHVVTVWSELADARPSTKSESLEVRIADAESPDAVRRPSNVFDDEQENSKGFWSKRAIVARGVTLAGWIQGGDALGRNDDNGGYGSDASEDWHYNIWLDHDFIERNYGLDTKPLAGARMGGNQIQVRLFTPIIGLLGDNAPGADTLMLPGSNVPNQTVGGLREASGLVVELNAWHMHDTPKGKGRGDRPPGWMPDPENGYNNNAWPFDPRSGSVGSRPIMEGDYVILNGTLWQDSAHFSEDRSGGYPEAYRRRWDELYPNHGGWLEIHPVDRIERVDPAPPLRRHVGVIGACARLGEVSIVDTYLSPNDAKVEPPPNAHLKFRVIVDGRFTRPGTYSRHSATVDSCDPTKLRVRVIVVGNDAGGDGGAFKATYLMWWERGSESKLPRDCPASPSVPQRPIDHLDPGKADKT